MINGHEVYGGSPPFTELSEQQQSNLVGVVKEIVESQARVEDANTNPGFVVLSTKPSCELYRKAVTTLVALEEVLAILKDHHAVYEGYKNKRGLIGATAAVSWEPGDRTYEIITYRPRERWGTKRQVDARSVQQMDMKCTGTFDNYDTLNRHNRLVPASPCPILYGIRGENPEELRLAVELVKSEPMESWLLFETNQGTDDHLMRKSIVKVQSFESVIVQGTVVEP
ncbi:MAG: putative DNA-binding protein containing a Zn-ribbon domain, partial [Thermoplasmatales archaeon]|nr:putative DNA-binding protein containing a Zn-ribbon domain [Thermoplasmatales archaeon]